MRSVIAVVVLGAGILLGEPLQDPSQGGAKIAQMCPGAWYTSEKCACSESKSDKCSCGTCTRDDKCECIAALKKGAGTASGTVKSSLVKKYPTVVYIDEMPGREFKAPFKNPAMDQKAKVFIPRILPVLVGTAVDFTNQDDFEHNVFSPDGDGYNLGNFKKGEKRTYTFNRPGSYVQLCKLHPEMVGYVVALKTPYFAVADEEGKFRIPNVPAGTWKLKIWNERLKPKQLEAAQEVKIEEGKESSVEIKP